MTVHCEMYVPSIKNSRRGRISWKALYNRNYTRYIKPILPSGESCIGKALQPPIMVKHCNVYTRLTLHTRVGSYRSDRAREKSQTESFVKVIRKTASRRLFSAPGHVEERLSSLSECVQNSYARPSLKRYYIRASSGTGDRATQDFPINLKGAAKITGYWVGEWNK